ncbi:MAG: hypothetical protein Q8K07_09855 [Methylicorpusculum sp.]|uniref:hypothetical protein n=1 Tax=Methylicorpusculum sp. TaxID=2713644 RepID=UPI002731F010|nr:hypothetical protein [Methylicorpusculum sp.]MDP2202311.1 hypothetical protein [Methylicorpusculum sp.]
MMIEDNVAWQPIETAPKDGTLILAGENFRRVDDNDKEYPPDKMTVRWIRGGWVCFGVWVKSFEPTHWMPCPNLPIELPMIKQDEDGLNKSISEDAQKCYCCGGSGETKLDYSDFRLYGLTHEECSKCGGKGVLEVVND